MSGSLQTLAFLAASIVFLGLSLLRLGPGVSRTRLRRTAILFALWVICRFGASALRSADAGNIAVAVGLAADLLEVFVVVNLTAIALFDVVLHILRWRCPDIVYDLGLGTAYLFAVGWLLHRSGVNLTSLLTTSAVVTAVVGLSLQATLGSIVGGVVLQFDESVKEGDWIELENKTQGLVKKIRWRHTVVETRDWDTVIIPNSTLLSQTIKILGKRTGHALQHRMWIYFNVDFRYPPGEVIRVVNEALRSAPIENVAADPQPHCICYDFAKDGRDSFAYYAVRYWLTDLAKDDPTNSVIRERVYAALRRAEVPLAVPATAVFVSSNDPAHEERKRTRELESRVGAIESVDLFSRLSPEEKLSLAQAARATPFARGETMTRQGASAHWLYILTKGEAEVRVAGVDGQDRKVADLNAPSFFGEMALMTGAPREATVIARGEVECLRIDKQDFEGIVARRPELAREISTILAQRRVELAAVRENLDAEAKARRMAAERGTILRSIGEFFGLTDVASSARPPSA